MTNFVTDVNLGADFDLGVLTASKINIKRATASVAGLMALTDAASYAVPATKALDNLAVTPAYVEAAIVGGAGKAATGFGVFNAATNILPYTTVDGAGGTIDMSDLIADAVASVVFADATETVKGRVELATTAETQTGTDATRAVTPAGLKAVTDALSAAGGYTLPAATEADLGGVRKASTADAAAGTDNADYVTPKNVADYVAANSPAPAAASETVAGVIEIATPVEAAAGTATNLAITPLQLATAVAAVSGGTLAINDAFGVAIDTVLT